VTYFDKGANPLTLATLLVSSLSLWVACRASPASPSDTLEGMILIPGGWFIMGSQAQYQTFFRDSSHSVKPNPRVGFRCAVSIPLEPTGSPDPLAGTP
jgi:hypothetical protein